MTEHLNDIITEQTEQIERLKEALHAVLPYAQAEAEGLEGFRHEGGEIAEEADAAWAALDLADAAIAACTPKPKTGTQTKEGG